MVTEVIDGVDVPSEVRIAWYWMYRRTGLWIAPPVPTGWNADQDASGVGVSPERVANVTPASVPWALSVRHAVMCVPASKTREVNVPEAGYVFRLSSSTDRAP